MTLGDKKLFSDKHLLATMLTLRTQGWATTSLSLLFSCDRDSIEKWCERYEAHPGGQVYTIERIAKVALKPLTDTKWKIRDGEKVHKGFSYNDYLSKYPHRKMRQLA